jgi:hypothetical protein
MITLLATAIAYLWTDADLRLEIDGQIASKHRFGGEGWATPSKALTIQYATGATPDINAGMERARIEARCWGPSQEEAEQVYGRLIRLTDTLGCRVSVPLDSGETALLYYLVPDDSPQFDRDPDIGVDFLRVFLTAACHRESVAA